MTKKVYKIKGMNCPSCASMIELDLEDAGIKAKCSYPNSSLEVEGKYDSKKVIETVKKSGYSISPVE
jgi:copper chaperone CopZ